MSKTLLSLIGAAALGAAALLPALAATPAAPAGTVSPGDTPEYTWKTPMVHGMGTSSLADLKGKLVLVEFWGTR